MFHTDNHENKVQVYTLRCLITILMSNQKLHAINWHTHPKKTLPLKLPRSNMEGLAINVLNDLLLSQSWVFRAPHSLLQMDQLLKPFPRSEVYSSLKEELNPSCEFFIHYSNLLKWSGNKQINLGCQPPQPTPVTNQAM